MGSDIARRSYDETKQYRRVVEQQGRVILEADINEAQEILAEEARKEALDLVGPIGIPAVNPLPGEPGVGYEVTSATSGRQFDFAVGAGVIYVGGLRVELRKAIHYLDQRGVFARGAEHGRNAHPDREIVYLELEEQEVSAVEDRRLREPALGGPDTAQRVHLVQRIKRRGVEGETCDDAFAELVTAWRGGGQSLEPETMRLRSGVRLQASYAHEEGKPNECEPEARGGYLGDENQLLRIQISPNQGNILWAYDGGSALYRATVEGDGRTLKLESAPVDAYHHPRRGQVVEVLLPAVDLGPNAADGAHDHAAASVGFVVAVDAAYNADSRTIRLASVLPRSYRAAADRHAGGRGPHPLFVRVWERELPFSSGEPRKLEDASGNGIGLTVTLTVDDGALVAGDFWLLALRPSVPKSVDPPRFLLGPQPPDGPRRWGCPLALIRWDARTDELAEAQRCPPLFDDLVTLTRRAAQGAARGAGCCKVEIGPEDVRGDLQTIVDGQIGRGGGRLRICLRAGAYLLDKPLRLGREHSGITLDGCDGEAALQAAPGAERAFLDGLVVVTHAERVALLGLRFVPPAVPFAAAEGKLAGLARDELKSEHAAWLDRLHVCIGVRVAASADVTVRDCIFDLPRAGTPVLFGAGIFAGGEVRGVRVERSRFAGEDAPEPGEAPLPLLFGYLHAPTTVVRSSAAGARSFDAVSGGDVVLPELSEASIVDNVFSSLTAAVLTEVDAGDLRLERNQVRGSHGGFWLYRTAFLIDSTTLFDPLLQNGLRLAHAYPAPEGLEASHMNAVEAVGDAGEPKLELDPAAFFARITRDAARAFGRAPSAGEIAAAALLGDLHGALAAVERAYARSAVRKRAQVPSLLASGNHVELSAFASEAASALAIVDGALEGDAAAAAPARAVDGSAVVSANLFRSASTSSPTVALVAVTDCAITGNVAINGKADGYSLFVTVSPKQELRSPVMGNALGARNWLPTRPLDAPLDTWSVLNDRGREAPR